MKCRESPAMRVGTGIAWRSPVVLRPKDFRARRSRHRRRLASRRGFTMMEMLAVVALIAVLAAGASPSLIQLTRERRVDFAAASVADLYRTARTRAMGRGSATLVRWDKNVAEPTSAITPGHFTLREAVLGNGGTDTMLPAMSCFAADWSNTGVTSKFVAMFDERPKRFSPAQATFLDADGAEQTIAEVCFTPRGRTFYRASTGGTFNALNGVVRARMKNTSSGSWRQIVIPPSGAARVVTEL